MPPQHSGENLQFAYDSESDVLTIEGMKYSGHLFRKFGWAFQIGEIFTIVERRDGVLTVKKVRLEDDAPNVGEIAVCAKSQGLTDYCPKCDGPKTDPEAR